MKLTKPVLMIHEFLPIFYEMGEILEQYIITLDDGLYSQYEALEFLKTLNTPKIFFISTGIVRPDVIGPNKEIIKCHDAHIKAFDSNFENYMSWDEIEEINQYVNCFIGGHSHNHPNFRAINSIRDRYNIALSDTKEMVKHFNEHKIDTQGRICFPYNYNDGIYAGVLQKFRFNEFYGSDRKAIEDII